jgi:hypothetical protein
MTEISEAAYNLAWRIDSGGNIAPTPNMVQSLIDEAVRRAREEREEAMRPIIATPSVTPGTTTTQYERKSVPYEYGSGEPIASRAVPEPSPAPPMPTEGVDSSPVPERVTMVVDRFGFLFHGDGRSANAWDAHTPCDAPHRVVEYVRADALEKANARIAELEQGVADLEGMYLKARAKVERLKGELASTEKHADNWQEEAEVATIAREAETERADKLLAEIERLKGELGKRPAMGPIPDEVVEKAVRLYAPSSVSQFESWRAALEAVRGELCQHEVVRSAYECYLSGRGAVWMWKPTDEGVILDHGPFTPVLLVRDPGREMVK